MTEEEQRDNARHKRTGLEASKGDEYPGHIMREKGGGEESTDGKGGKKRFRGRRHWSSAQGRRRRTNEDGRVLALESHQGGKNRGWEKA